MLSSYICLVSILLGNTVIEYFHHSRKSCWEDYLKSLNVVLGDKINIVKIMWKNPTNMLGSAE